MLKARRKDDNFLKTLTTFSSISRMPILSNFVQFRALKGDIINNCIHFKTNQTN